MMINAKSPGSWSNCPRQSADSGDNPLEPERIRGTILGREGSRDAMDRDRQTAGAGLRILLVAMAIQGLTPDRGDLASSRLLQLVASGLVDCESADSGSAPSSIPIPRDWDDGLPGVLGSTLVASAALRTHLDTGGRPALHFLPAGLLNQLIRSVPRSLRPAGIVVRGPDGLIVSICRFLC
jgi:hypothetical protein